MSSANQIYSVDMTDAERPQIKLAQTLPSDDNRFGESDVAIHDSRWLIMGSDTLGELILWDISVQPGRLIKTIRFDTKSPIKGLSWSADGRLLVVPVGDWAVRVWDIDWTRADDPIFTLRDQQVLGTLAVMSPQESVMATWVDGHAEIELWDVSQTPFERLSQIEGGRKFAFSPDGKHLAIAVHLGIELYAHENAEWVRRYLLSEGMAAVTSLAWSPD